MANNHPPSQPAGLKTHGGTEAINSVKLHACRLQVYLSHGDIAAIADTLFFFRLLTRLDRTSVHALFSLSIQPNEHTGTLRYNPKNSKIGRIGTTARLSLFRHWKTNDDQL
ncbi:hypothetical protein PSHT_15840 [Puccinia striiformis]|uniref:Uncharacterized protein n=1 Tax=Puccinia striiformis TaxID=27350 RepID=A0A2S4UCY4_9BASI|nr:hypothetical protein PSHT_15840 [Puccinia striiformis]